ncbi:nucleotide exchange factor GrpE [Bacillus chungangensis]|uniref:Protein GrpE n=1 Tax=Bacillus chungangensis TaxID=587633 RepID=A0ABT9WLW9_9BACI|nr:nucleotide exchange factor GrpE [Bacillus chungangensis]MDQ0174196.1 molecular chaperone GrpE [Bacillus chungangensis]
MANEEQPLEEQREDQENEANATAEETPNLEEEKKDEGEVQEAVADEEIDPSEKIKELEQKLAEYENSYLRLRADFDNYRRREQKERESYKKYRAQDLISSLLPALDNFERAMQVEPENEQSKTLIQGMDMIYRELIKALEAEGAVQIEAVGKEFDPHLHQAVMQVEDESYDSNIVVEEFQKGYQLKDRVIRPSMVKVNQ